MPGVDVPAGWNVSYHSVNFGVTLEPIKVDLRPVYDGAGRTVIYVVETLTFVTMVTPDENGDDTEAVMATIRSTLTRPGGELRVEGVGYGDLVVNSTSGGGTRDVIWGPKPRRLSTEQIGDDQAWKITWQLETAIAEHCQDEALKKKKLLEWNYSISYSLPDAAGLTTRRVTGKVRIPQTRRTITSRALEENVDEIREAIMDFQLVPGFRREGRNWDISLDKCEATFSVTDVQMQWLYAPPKGIVDVQMRHSMDSVAAHNLFMWTHVLSAEYRVGRGYHKLAAFNHFIAEFRRRREIIQRSKKQQVLPMTFSMTEHVYADTVSMAIRWLVAVGDKDKLAGLSAAEKDKLLEVVVPENGQFTTPLGSDWQGWATYLNGSQSSRGVAGLRYVSGADQIIDICFPSNDTPALKSQSSNGQGKKILAEIFPKGKPDRDRSWLRYRNRVRVIERDENVILPLLPPDGDRIDPKPKKKAPGDSAGFLPIYPPAKGNGGDDVIIQTRRRPLYHIEVSGDALRAGYAIDPPHVLEIGGKKATPVNGPDCGFRSEVIGELLTPLVYAQWKFRYALHGVPTKPIAAPPNLMHGEPDGEGSDNMQFFVG